MFNCPEVATILDHPMGTHVHTTYISTDYFLTLFFTYGPF